MIPCFFRRKEGPTLKGSKSVFLLYNLIRCIYIKCSLAFKLWFEISNHVLNVYIARVIRVWKMLYHIGNRSPRIYATSTSLLRVHPNGFREMRWGDSTFLGGKVQLWRGQSLIFYYQSEIDVFIWNVAYRLSCNLIIVSIYSIFILHAL